MLEHLFGSQTRAKLLSLFLRRPDEPVFVREITRRIDTQINAVRRELANLERIGFIEEIDGVETSASETKKSAGVRRKYYQLKSTFSLLPELRALVMKSQVMLDQKMDAALSKIGEIRYAAVMGAFLGPSKGPVDLFIVGQVDVKALKPLLDTWERELGFEINYSLMTPEEFIYRKEIMDRFLTSILEAPKNVLVDRFLDRKSDK